jgi:hypothetical protein
MVLQGLSRNPMLTGKRLFKYTNVWPQAAALCQTISAQSPPMRWSVETPDPISPG